MNIPNSFKFRKWNGSHFYTATTQDNGMFLIENSYGEKMFNVTPTNVADHLESKYWKIIEEPKTYETIAQDIGKLVAEKNKQYGDAFNKSGDYLKILYPNGIEPHQYKEALALVRDFDKSMRVANGNQGNENARNDKAGYGILMSGGNENE